MVSSILAGSAGTGQAIQNKWNEISSNSWIGLENMYKKGEISKEKFETIKTIRNLTDEQWSQIKTDYKNNKISEEEYGLIRQIRKMPNDWRTVENAIKGITYGVGIGTWEGLQWYVGGKLAGTTFTASKVVDSAIRIGADTSFNALDTPFRTLWDALTTGKDIEKAWNDLGGKEAVLTDIGIGFLFSFGSEGLDFIKNYKDKILNNNNNINTKTQNDTNVTKNMSNNLNDNSGISPFENNYFSTNKKHILDDYSNIIETRNINKNGEKLYLAQKKEIEKMGNTYRNSCNYDVYLENGKQVGAIEATVINLLTPDTVEIIYEAFPEYRGKGNIPISLNEVLDDIFNNKSLDNLTVRENGSKSEIKKIFLSIAKDNKSSLEVAKKCGFDIKETKWGDYNCTITKSEFLSRIKR